MVDRPKRKQIRPLPELLVPGKWDVKHGMEPHVDRSARTMEVSLGDTPQARQLRAHEMAHVRWSPVSYDKGHLEASSILAAEESRIHRKMRDAGIPLDTELLTGWRKARLLEEWADMPPSMQMKLAVASLYTADEALVLPLIEATWHENDQYDLKEVAEHFYLQSDGSWKSTMEFARWMERLGDEMDRRYGFGSDDESGQGDTEGEDGDGESTASGESGGGGEVEGDEWGSAFSGPMPLAENVWGDMEVRLPPLPIPLRIGMLYRKTVSVEDGLFMHRPERWATDKKIFGMKFKRKGHASVLIDVSGSMRLNNGEIQRIIEAMPGSIIALYSGDGNKGHLTVVARKGRRVSNISAHRGPGGNVVDGPALRWLAKQRRPLYWVCDGIVTGVNDCDSENLIVDARRVVRLNKIQRIPDLSGVLVQARKDGIIK